MPKQSKNEGATKTTVVFSPTGQREKRKFELKNLRNYFDAICAQLSKQKSEDRVRHIRTTENPITLRELVQIGQNINREVGVFYDKVGKTDTASSSYTKICLYAGEASLKRARGRSDRLNVAASISYPPGGERRYQFIAHYHPTDYDSRRQLDQDINHASSQVEMVITASSKVFYYNEDGCFNRKERAPLLGTGMVYVQRFSDEVSDPTKNQFRMQLDDPITEGTLARLDKIKPSKIVNINFDSSSIGRSGRMSLFADNSALDSGDDSDDSELSPNETKVLITLDNH
jgi:hypothetical protein